MELVTKSEIIDFCVRLYEPEYEEIKDNIKKNLILLPFKEIVKRFENKGCKIKQINPIFYSLELSNEYKDLLNNIEVKNFNNIHNKSKEYGYYSLPIGD